MSTETLFRCPVAGCIPCCGVGTKFPCYHVGPHASRPFLGGLPENNAETECKLVCGKDPEYVCVPINKA